MSAKENVEVAKRWNLEVMNQRKTDCLEEVLHPQYQWHCQTDSPWSTEPGGIMAVKEYFVSGDWDPNFRITIDDIFGAEDKVALRMTFWSGEKPTSVAIAIYRFADGKIIDDWACTTPLT